MNAAAFHRGVQPYRFGNVSGSIEPGAQQI
jgi:hypothetical protein